MVAAALSVALLVGTGLVIRTQQDGSRAEIISRFNLRAEIGARFLESYVTELLTHERQAAAASTSQRAFVDVTTTLGFQAALLADSTGRVLRVFPDSPSLVGTRLGSAYPMLRQGMNGHVAVSNVQESGLGLGAVWLSVPFASDGGLRIYSGALSVSTESVISPFMRTVAPLEGAEVWLIDDMGQTVGGSSPLTRTEDLLKTEDSALFAAIQRSSTGVYQGVSGVSRFTVAAVAGTPWRLVVAVQESLIFVGVGDFSAAIPWLIFAGLVLAAATAAVLQIKLSRARAQQLEEVALLSLTDPLTGLYNRRGYEVVATQVLKDAGREGRMATLMYFDINGLKGINDTLGHAAGDDAIIAAAAVLSSTFRDSDVIARLGGDEFCVVGVMPGPPESGSAPFARLQEAVARHNERENPRFHLSLSAGQAIWEPDVPKSLEALEEEADRRMYTDKMTEQLVR